MIPHPQIDACHKCWRTFLLFTATKTMTWRNRNKKFYVEHRQWISAQIIFIYEWVYFFCFVSLEYIFCIFRFPMNQFVMRVRFFFRKPMKYVVQNYLIRRNLSKMHNRSSHFFPIMNYLSEYIFCKIRLFAKYAFHHIQHLSCSSAQAGGFIVYPAWSNEATRITLNNDHSCHDGEPWGSSTAATTSSNQEQYWSCIGHESGRLIHIGYYQHSRWRLHKHRYTDKHKLSQIWKSPSLRNVHSSCLTVVFTTTSSDSLNKRTSSTQLDSSTWNIDWPTDLKLLVLRTRSYLK